MSFEEFAPKIEAFFGLKLDPNAPTENVSNSLEDAYREAQEKNRLLCSKEEYADLKKAFEESKKDADDQNVNYGGYIPVSITATRILNKKAGLAWTTTDYSGEKIPVYAIGSGAKMFDGKYDDTDVAIRIGEAMGFNPEPTNAHDHVEESQEKPTGVGLQPAE